MRSRADLRGGTPLVSFNHVIDPHFVAFSSSLYTTICKPNPNLNSNPDPNPNRNPTVITDRQIGPIDPQIVTVQIRPAPHFVVCPCWREIESPECYYCLKRGNPGCSFVEWYVVIDRNCQRAYSYALAAVRRLCSAISSPSFYTKQFWVIRCSFCPNNWISVFFGLWRTCFGWRGVVLVDWCCW